MGSCGANRREFEDQSAIKRKFRLKWDKTKLVSHFWGAKNVERKEEKKKKKKRKGMEYYGYVFVYGSVVWMAMFLYGTCMEVFVRILVVPFLGFS